MLSVIIELIFFILMIMFRRRIRKQRRRESAQTEKSLQHLIHLLIEESAHFQRICEHLEFIPISSFIAIFRMMMKSVIFILKWEIPAKKRTFIRTASMN